jgi:hypothetical protein
LQRGNRWNLFQGENEMKTRLTFGALPAVLAALSLHDLGFAKPALGAVAGQAARVVPPGSFVIRRRVPGPNNASVHSKEVDGADVSEVYYILEGTGEQITGGSYDPKNRTAGIKGGEEHPFKAETCSLFRGEQLTGSARLTATLRISRSGSRAMCWKRESLERCTSSLSSVFFPDPGHLRKIPPVEFLA